MQLKSDNNVIGIAIFGIGRAGNLSTYICTGCFKKNQINTFYKFRCNKSYKKKLLPRKF